MYFALPDLPATGENANVIAIHEQLGKISYLVLGCEQFVKILFRFIFVQDDVLRRFMCHAMTCKEHEDQMFKVCFHLKTFTKSYDEITCLLVRNVVVV